MASKANRKAKYKFVMSRYVIENLISDRWGYETQVQKLPIAKKIVKRLVNGENGRGNRFRVYDNVLGNVVYPRKEIGNENNL